MSDMPEVTVSNLKKEEPAAFAAPPEEKKKKRAPKQKKEKKFLVASDDGVVICLEGDLVQALSETTNANVYLLDKKVASIKHIPGEVDVLSGEKGEDSIEIKYE